MSNDNRIDVPAEIERAVLVEAGHRCAIPTCRQTTTEIAHIVPWAQSHDNSFENLIALCPNDHTRYDQKKEIDRKSIRMYKQNLGIVNSRYSEFERRLFTWIAETGRDFFMVAAGFEILLDNAVRDGILELNDDDSIGMIYTDSETGEDETLPLHYSYYVTNAGKDFVARYVSGDELP